MPWSRWSRNKNRFAIKKSGEYLRTIEEIFESIRDGKNKMPGFKKKLSKQEIEELAAHIDYSSLVKKVMDRRGQIEKELNEIQENYEVLPDCSQ